MISVQNFEFNLGFGIKTTSPQEAGELLMKREYPQILESATTPHDVIFIPEVYLYGKLAEKVNIYYFNCIVVRRELWLIKSSIFQINQMIQMINLKVSENKAHK
jgi:hypothetical protein